MVDRIMVTKDVHVLIPGTCEYITLHGKGNFANVINLQILDEEIIFYYLGELFIKDLQKVTQERRCYVAGFEDRERVHKWKNIGSL